MDINQLATSLKTYLKIAQPTWIITRDVSEYQSNAVELGGKTFLTIVVISGRKTGQGVFGRAPTDDCTLMVLGQVNVASSNYTGEQIEQIELTIKTKVRAALAAPTVPQDLSGVVIDNWVTSGQQNKEAAEILLTLSLKEI